MRPGSPRRPGLARVCLLTSSHPVEYSRFFDREAVSLARVGYSVTLIGLGSAESTSSVRGVKLVSLARCHGVSKAGLLCRIARIARGEGADVYHCLDPWTLGVGLGLKRLSGPRVVYESSEHFPRSFLERNDLPFPVRAAGYSIIRALECRAAHNANAIIETNLTRARRFGAGWAERITMVPNYPPLDVLPPLAEERRPWFAYTGLVSRQRGFDKLLAAMAIVVKGRPEARLRIFGEFDPHDDIAAWSRRFIEQAGIGANVEFVGWLPYGRMLQELRQCLTGLVVLQPRRYNDFTGLPNKLFEFMGCGLDVIASRFPEMSRVVDATGCGRLVDPTDTTAIAGLLAAALDDPDSCIRRGVAGRNAVHERFHWGVSEAALLDLYARLVP